MDLAIKALHTPNLEVGQILSTRLQALKDPLAEKNEPLLELCSYLMRHSEIDAFSHEQMKEFFMLIKDHPPYLSGLHMVHPDAEMMELTLERAAQARSHPDLARAALAFMATWESTGVPRALRSRLKEILLGQIYTNHNVSKIGAWEVGGWDVLPVARMMIKYFPKEAGKVLKGQFPLLPLKARISVPSLLVEAALLTNDQSLWKESLPCFEWLLKRRDQDTDEAANFKVSAAVDLFFHIFDERWVGMDELPSLWKEDLLEMRPLLEQVDRTSLDEWVDADLDLVLEMLEKLE